MTPAVRRPDGSFEEDDEHGSLVQTAYPGLGSGESPRPVVAGCGPGTDGMDLAAAIRLGDRDSRHFSRHQPGQPLFSHRRSGVESYEAPVTESGCIAQIGVVIATDELHQRLNHRGPAASAVPGWDSQAEVPAKGKLPADPGQPLAAAFGEVSSLSLKGRNQSVNRTLIT